MLLLFNRLLKLPRMLSLATKNSPKPFSGIAAAGHFFYCFSLFLLSQSSFLIGTVKRFTTIILMHLIYIYIYIYIYISWRISFPQYFRYQLFVIQVMLVVTCLGYICLKLNSNDMNCTIVSGYRWKICTNNLILK